MSTTITPTASSPCITDPGLDPLRQADQTELRSRTTGDTLPPERPVAPGAPGLEAPATQETDPVALQGFVATPSPGAVLAALCIRDACEQIRQNQETLTAQNENVVRTLREQADNIMTSAISQLAVGIATSAISIGLSAAASVKTMKIDNALQGAAFEKAMVPVRALNTAAQETGRTGSSVSAFLGSYFQAENKKLDAVMENSRFVMEQIRTSQTAQRELIAKSLEFMNAMQAGMNQTRTRILG